MRTPRCWAPAWDNARNCVLGSGCLRTQIVVPHRGSRRGTLRRKPRTVHHTSQSPARAKNDAKRSRGLNVPPFPTGVAHPMSASAGAGAPTPTIPKRGVVGAVDGYGRPYFFSHRSRSRRFLRLTVANDGWCKGSWHREQPGSVQPGLTETKEPGWDMEYQRFQKRGQKPGQPSVPPRAGQGRNSKRRRASEWTATSPARGVPATSWACGVASHTCARAGSRELPGVSGTRV